MLYGWDNSTATGWYRCTVHGRSLSATDPTANFVVKYKSGQTDKALNGNVACELTAHLYGADMWWVLLE